MYSQCSFSSWDTYNLNNSRRSNGNHLRRKHLILTMNGVADRQTKGLFMPQGYSPVDYGKMALKIHSKPSPKIKPNFYKSMLFLKVYFYMFSLPNFSAEIQLLCNSPISYRHCSGSDGRVISYHLTVINYQI